jgi:hypothetical protein
VSSTLSVEHDDCEPLDRDRSVAYRFGKVKWPDQWDPPVRFSFIHFPPRAKRYRAGPFGFCRESARSFRNWSV